MMGTLVSVSAFQRAAFSGLCGQFSAMVWGERRDYFEQAIADCVRSDHMQATLVTPHFTECIQAAGVRWEVVLPEFGFAFAFAHGPFWELTGTEYGTPNFGPASSGLMLPQTDMHRIWESLRNALTTALHSYGLGHFITAEESFFGD